MKIFHFAFLLIFFSVGINSASANNTLLMQKLMAVNSEWNKQVECKAVINAIDITQIKIHNDWIALHLNLIEHTLRNRTHNHFSEKQIENRLLLLDKLNEYWHEKIFPINDYKTYKTPVFIDRKGTHCAVGYLMQQSGYEALAQEINAQQPFAYVHEITVAGVQQWADEHGFSIDELAWIQPGYPPTLDALEMKKGFDGTVNAMAIDPINGSIYAAGSFTKATEGMNCNSIAAWISGFAGFDWIALNDGVNGTVHTLLIHNNKLYVGGSFTMAGNIAANHVAIYDLATNQWQAMGSLDNTVRALAIYNNDIYAGGDFTGLVSKWNGTTWESINSGLIDGAIVNALQVYNNNLVIGGNFDLLTGAPRKHVALYDGTDMTLMGFGTLTPVNDFEIHNNQLYAACNFISGNDTCALAIFDDINDDWKVELKPNSTAQTLSYLFGNSFHCLLSVQGKLLIGGNFFSSMGMVEGSNLAEYKKVSYPNDTILYSVIEPYLSLDSSINCLAVANNNEVYFGGEFITNAFVDTLNHIGYINLLTVGTQHVAVKKKSLKAYPNPCTDVLSIKSDETNEIIKGYEIYDAIGKYLEGKHLATSTNNISLKHLPKGIYTIKISTANSIEIARVVKQ